MGHLPAFVNSLNKAEEWLADLAAQLPLVVRGIYFEGWNLSATPVKVRDLGVRGAQPHEA